ncbi:MAG: putative DNA binding domain-containing protein [Firmicutes bacterium]|nr:putative DNA binding domain-containing protein [Bacillota bacterium]
MTVEFKSDLKRYPDREIVEEIVGMTNAEGGNLYLGIEDDATPTGVHETHKDPVGVAALIANMTVPAISVRAEIIQQNGREIMKIEVPMSRTIVATSGGKILRRRLNSEGKPENVPMYPYEMPSRLSELSLLDYSAQSLSGATLDDLDPNERVRLRKIIQNRQGGEKNLLQLTDEEMDRALRLVTEQDGQYVPTVTGMLLIGKEERLKKLMPTLRTDFQVLEGTTVRMNETMFCPLLDVFERIETYVNAWNPEREMEYGLFRLPIPEFDRNAFREGLVNAFCHRDYTMLGSVRVLIDDEGMTISSPGGFIDGVNLKNLLTVEPHGRNQVLADALKRVGLAEKTGRGIDRIYEGSIIYGRPWPDFSETTSRNVKLYIQRAKPDLSFAKMVADEQNRLGRTLSIYPLMILSALKNERRATVERLVEITNLTDARIRTSIENLVECGLIEAVGNGKTRTYILSAKVYRESDESAEYVRQTGIDKIRYPELVLKLAKQQNGFVTKSDVCDLLKISEKQAYTVLKKMIEEGMLKKANGGRYAKYTVIV